MDVLLRSVLISDLRSRNIARVNRDFGGYLGVELLWILLTIPTVLGIGFVASAVGILTTSRRQILNAVAYYVALPALLFSSTAGQSVSEIATLDLVVGVGIVFSLTLGLAFLLHRPSNDPALRSVGIIQSYHTNFGYLGVPLVAVIFGDLATARAALILGVGALVQVSATIVVLTTMNGTGRPRAELGRIGRNPILLSIAAGLTVATLAIEVPAMSIRVLEGVGDLALPLALLCVGASLTLSTFAVESRTTWTVIGLNVLFMPILAFLTFGWLGSDTATIQAGVFMFAMPTAVSTYVFAGELGGNTDLASVNVFATTVVSTVTMFVIAQLLFVLV